MGTKEILCLMSEQKSERRKVGKQNEVCGNTVSETHRETNTTLCRVARTHASTCPRGPCTLHTSYHLLRSIQAKWRMLTGPLGLS